MRLAPDWLTRGRLIGLGALVSIVLWVIRPAEVTPLNAVLALATLWVSGAPFAVYFLRRDKPPMPFIALAGLYYAVFYGLSVFFFRAPKPEEIQTYGLRILEISVEAQLLVLCGVALMLGVFYLLRPRFARRFPHLTLPRDYPAGRLRLMLWILLATYLLWRWVPAIHGLPSIGQFIQSVGPLALGMFLVLWHRKELPWPEAVLVAFGALPLILFQDIASGLLTGAVLLCAFLMIIMLYLRKRLFWLAGVLPILLVSILYPGVSFFRIESWNEAAPDRTVAERVVSLLEHTKKAWQRDVYFERSTLRPLRHRFSGFILMSHVVNLTPSEVPYWKGETYRPLPTSFIPRALWPGKPEERSGHAFGHRYRILNSWDKGTSINIPWIVEMYANFGRVGVLVGMALVGVFLALLSSIFNRREMSPLEFVIGAAIIFPLVYPASNFSLMTGSLLPLALSLWLFFRIGLRLGVRDRTSGGASDK